MDFFRTLDVSASGLQAQRARMDAVTENLANSETTVTASGRPYQRKIVLLRSVDAPAFPDLLRADGSPAGGVKVSAVVEAADPARRVFLPGHPQANAEGIVEFPNVNPIVEMVDMLTTTRAYEANATAFQATKGMVTKLLELLR